MRYILIVFIMIGFLSCKKDKTDPKPPGKNPSTTGTLSFVLHYKVSGADLETDKIIYTNEAGNRYSVWTLKAILSAFNFHKPAGEWKDNNYYYIDVSDNNFNKITVNKIPAGTYTGFDFLIGIDSIHNQHDSLPATIEFQNMIWPTMMGGGFHFLKLEGQFISPADTLGYTVHVGQNGNTSLNSIDKVFTVSPGGVTTIDLFIDINEWYKTPNTFNFNTDGYSTMDDTTAMRKIAENGRDVFYTN